MTTLDLLLAGLTNAAFATVLAVAGWLLTRFWANAHVASVVWLAVLLKLVTPPVVSLPVAITASTLREGETPAEPRNEATEVGSQSLGDVRPIRPLIAEYDDSETRFLNETGFLDSGRHLPEGDIEAASGDDGSEPDWRATGVSLPVGSPAVSAPATTRAASEARLLEEAGLLKTHVASLLLAVWIAGTLLLGLVTIARIVRFHRTLWRAASIDHEMQRTAVRVASRLGLKRCPAVRSVAVNVGPMVWAGSLRPLVIVPRPLWDSLGGDERETLLAHELAHVVRRDHWVRRFEAVVLALYWWLPTAWLAVRRREVAAETCCDALVLSHYPDRPQAYAEALLTAVSVLSTSRTPALASGLGRASELKERLTMIVHDRVPNRPGRLVRWSILLVAGVALVVSARLVQAEPEEKLEPASAAEPATATAIAPTAAAPATTDAAPAAILSAGEQPPTAPAYEQPTAAAPASAAAPAGEPAAAKPSATSDEILFFGASWAGTWQQMKPI
ncbi:MAG: M56 family metallopeptidase, partial [Planctomycetaceae bacterium]